MIYEKRDIQQTAIQHLHDAFGRLKNTPTVHSDIFGHATAFFRESFFILAPYHCFDLHNANV